MTRCWWYLSLARNCEAPFAMKERQHAISYEVCRFLVISPWTLPNDGIPDAQLCFG
ncbi:unnamed protein product [Allacma fusca]|uniref:Uncharacterized protein n=1 Tax=Allacma fusca TaxID=39272 RepID=A0A8J2K6U7_9HEXA|nr:unnamed protein product [Allacma fusca]